MTGPRRVRGRVGDDRRGRTEPARHEPIRTHIEIEELSVGRVASRGRPRPGLQATVLAAALLLLLAVGFGVFGGRDRPSEPAASTESLAAATQVVAAAQTPAVTPWAPCAASPPSPPDVRLVFNGHSIAATVELLEQPRGVPVSPSPAGGPIDGAPRTRVPAEATTSIWIPGAACANAWDVRVGSAVLDTIGNAGMQPAYASQNRFDVFLAPYGGVEADLLAELVFPTMAIRATWPLVIEPYPIPSAVFVTNRDERWSATAGCDISLQIRNAVVGIASSCFGIVPTSPRIPARNPAGAGLAFELDGWQFTSASISCGRVEGVDFQVDPASGCAESEYQTDLEGGATRVEFPGPTADGTWTIAVAICASPVDDFDTSWICGTWYGDVQVDESGSAT